jgi:hypothetical protein
MIEEENRFGFGGRLVDSDCELDTIGGCDKSRLWRRRCLLLGIIELGEVEWG